MRFDNINPARTLITPLSRPTWRRHILPVAVGLAIVAGFVGGVEVQLVANAVGDCHRDPIAFSDACQFQAEHPTLSAFFSR